MPSFGKPEAPDAGRGPTWGADYGAQPAGAGLGKPDAVIPGPADARAEQAQAARAAAGEAAGAGEFKGPGQPTATWGEGHNPAGETGGAKATEDETAANAGLSGKSMGKAYEEARESSTKDLPPEAGAIHSLAAWSAPFPRPVWFCRP